MTEPSVTEPSATEPSVTEWQMLAVYLYTFQGLVQP